MERDDAVRIAGTTHNFSHEGDDHNCVVCGGGGAALPTECPGAKLSDTMREAVVLGHADFVRGAWRVTL